MSYITFISVLIHSLCLTLRHVILTTFCDSSRVFVPSTITLLSLIFVTLPQLTFLLLRHPFKILYKTPNKPYKGMYNLINFDLASPSIDHSIKFSDSLRICERDRLRSLTEYLRIYLLASDTSERLYYLYGF